MKTKISKYILAGGNIILAFLAWRSIDRAVNVEGSSIWGAPILTFSLWMIFLSIFLVVEKRKLAVFLISLFSFFVSLIFTFSIIHLIILTLSASFILIISREFQKEMASQIRIDVSKMIRLKRGFIVLALSLAISSQYYFEIRDKEEAKLIPEFRFENLLGENFSQDLLRRLAPEMKNLSTGNPEVDKGIEDDLSELVNERLNSAITPNFSGGENEVIPLVMALILFITIWSVGSFFSRILAHAGGFIFFLSKKSGLIEIGIIQTEKEVIK